MKFIGSNKCIDRFLLLFCGVLASLFAYYFFNITGDSAILIMLSIIVISDFIKEKELRKEIDKLKKELKQK